MKRESGYYWVRCDSYWSIASFDESGWEIFGGHEDVYLKDSDFDEIDETRIVRIVHSRKPSQIFNEIINESPDNVKSLITDSNLRITPGEWLYSKTYYDIEFIFRYKNDMLTIDECYSVCNNMVCEIKDISLYPLQTYFRATPEQISTILIKVAIWKGFKEGIKYKFNDFVNRIGYGFMYYPKDDILCTRFTELGTDHYIIYERGKWAEIIPEKNSDLGKLYTIDLTDPDNPKIQKV